MVSRLPEDDSSHPADGIEVLTNRNSDTKRVPLENHKPSLLKRFSTAKSEVTSISTASPLRKWEPLVLKWWILTSIVMVFFIAAIGVELLLWWSNNNTGS